MTRSGNRTRLLASIISGGKGCRSRNETDETNWFDEWETLADTTEVRPPLTTLNGHRLLSIESLQQFLQTDITCSKSNEKLRSLSYTNGYKQGIADLQTYLCKESNTKKLFKYKCNAFLEIYESIDIVDGQPPSQNSRLIVEDYVSPFLGIASRISITCELCDSRKYIEPVICKNKKGLHEKGNQMGHFAINNMFVLGCPTKQEWVRLMLI